MIDRRQCVRGLVVGTLAAPLTAQAQAGEGVSAWYREVLVCPRCGGPRRILGAVTQPHAVRRVLAALGLAAEPPPPGIVVAS